MFQSSIVKVYATVFNVVKCSPVYFSSSSSLLSSSFSSLPWVLGSENKNTPFQISEEVREVLLTQQQHPRNMPSLVALETALVTHGMPWPTNYETALLQHQQIRQQNSVPMMIGVMNGKIKIGFEKSEMEELSRQQRVVSNGDNADNNIIGQQTSKSTENGQDNLISKISRHNLYNYHRVKYGGTTVAGTLIVCGLINKMVQQSNYVSSNNDSDKRGHSAAGVWVMSTGGIGGVHRDVAKSMDISADLQELGRHRLCVVSSGIKSLLDIAKTLQYLETEGVFVATLHSSRYFPGFLTRSASGATSSEGIESPNLLRNVNEVVKVLLNIQRLELHSGMLLAVPIPEQSHDKTQNTIKTETDKMMDEAISEALELAALKGISASEVTPFTLQKVNELTKGKSLELNVKLIENNATVAGQLARKLADENRDPRQDLISPTSISPEYIVVGGTILDINCKITDDHVDSSNIQPGGTYDSTVKQSSGGVARNIADVLTKLHCKTAYLTALGYDVKTEFIKSDNNQIDWSYIHQTKEHETSSVTVIHLPNNDIFLHVGDLKIHSCISEEYVASQLSNINKSRIKLIVSDGNIPVESLLYLIDFSNQHNIPLFYEPTDVCLIDKLANVIQLGQIQPSKLIDVISPNIHEFWLLMTKLGYKKDKKAYNTYAEVLKTLNESNLLEIIPTWIIKLGSKGIIFASKTDGSFYMKQSMFLVKKHEIVNASGAGDCMAGLIMTLRHKMRFSWTDSVRGGVKMAIESIKSESTVPNFINNNEFDENSMRRWINEMDESKLLTVYQ